MTKLISILTGILTLTVAGFAFAVSFTSLTEMAQEHNFPIPYLLPLTLEAGMIVFSANALYRKLNKESTKWQWTLVIFSSLTALTFNVLHAEQSLTSKIMFALPSLFLLLAFENFLSQVNHVIEKSSSIASIKELEDSLLILRQEFEDKTQSFNQEFESNKNKLSKTLTELEDKIKARTEKLKEAPVQEIKIGKKEERQKLILKLIKSGEGNLENLRQVLNVSYPTISGDIKELEANRAVYKEGREWKLNGKHSSR